MTYKDCDSSESEFDYLVSHFRKQGIPENSVFNITYDFLRRRTEIESNMKENKTHN